MPFSHSSLSTHLTLKLLLQPKAAVLSQFLELFPFSPPKSLSGDGSGIHLGKTSFVVKSRSMFPRVLLQWCTAIASCAAEIGKLFLRRRCVRLSASSASRSACKVVTAAETHNPQHPDSCSRMEQGMLCCWVVCKMLDCVLPVPYCDAVVSLSKSTWLLPMLISSHQHPLQ